MALSKGFLICALAISVAVPSLVSSGEPSKEFGTPEEGGITANNADVPTATCVFGNTTGLSNLQGLLNVGDAHYILINPADCATCNGQVVLRNLVLTLASDAQQEECSFELEATIVGAGGTSSCPVPDPGVILCAPQNVKFVPPFANVFYDAVIPAPDNCCINGPAFLRIEVTAMDDCQRLGLMIDQTCAPCQTYYFQSANGTLTDDCAVFGWTHKMFADADCCETVGVEPGAWSTIKRLYR